MVHRAKNGNNKFSASHSINPYLDNRKIAPGIRLAALYEERKVDEIKLREHILPLITTQRIQEKSQLESYDSVNL